MPATSMPWPAAPLDGLRAEITGGPPAASGAEGDVDVEVEDGAGPPAWPCPTVVGGWTAGPGGVSADAVCDGGDGAGAPPPLRDTTSATAAASTRAAAMATDRTSQGSGRPSDGGPGGRDGGSDGGVAPGAGSGGATVGEGSPDDARARRAALSIAPRARRPGVPWASSASCASVNDPPGRDSSRFGTVHARICSPDPGRLRHVHGPGTEAAAAHPRRIGPATGGIMRSDLTSGPPAPQGNPPAGGDRRRSDAGSDAISPLTNSSGTLSPRARLAFSDACSEPSTPGAWG